MAIPNSPAFSLGDVIVEIGLPTASSLSSCFSNANAAYFDPTYEGAKDRLSNFRNYQVNATAYDGIAYATAFGDNIFMKPDGAKFFLLETSTGVVRQYSTGSSFNISGGSYDSISVDLTQAAGEPTGFWFQPTTGTRVYTISTGVIAQKPMTAWDITTAGAGVTKSVVAQDAGMSALTWNGDGTRLFTGASVSGIIYQYNNGALRAFNLSFSSYASKSFSTGLSVQDIYVSPDGTKLFVMDSSTQDIHSYTMGTAGDLATISADGVSFSTTAQSVTMRSVHFKEDGTKFWCVNGVGTVHQYTTKAAWDIS